MNWYSKFVLEKTKSGVEIRDSLSPWKCDLIHMTFGVVGETGELLDTVKKYIIYNIPLDRQNIIEELGDIEFYLEGLRQTLMITREEVLKANVAKLSNRYKASYTDEEAELRRDKSNEETTK